MCVAPENYQILGCEEAELSCVSPSDCPAGLVCCNDGVSKVSCKPEQLCPGDGMPTYRMCDVKEDCPKVAPNCMPIANPDPDAGTPQVSICL